MDAITVVTFNMHKGMSPFNRHVRLEGIARALAANQPDLVFLQEVQGKNRLRALRHPEWSALPQHHYLARRLACRVAYGLNCAYDHGHHGNALLSRFPIVSWGNIDLSVNRYEDRGLLHCQVMLGDWPHPLDTLCAHLNVLGHDRRKQYYRLFDYIHHHISASLPLILAGDFNDWREQATDYLAEELGLIEVHSQLLGTHALTFPARMPFLALDRIYTRGLTAKSVRVLKQLPWPHLSDHLPVIAQLLPKD